MQLSFEAVAEARPGARWQSLFRRFWPAYRAWFQARSGPDQPSAEQGRAALRRFMPELLDTYDRLLELSDGSECAARLLSCYRPPAYLISCSQAAAGRTGARLLIRNYDLDPNLNEGLILHSAWTGRRVMATSEFLWGVADGMNDAGLALSLAFGGRRIVGHGFGMPLILRYVLEVCDDLRDAVAVLGRVPSHMAYNVTVLDRRGDCATVQVAPDRPVRVVRPAVATNHQGTVEWAEHARFTNTEVREKRLRALHDDPAMEQRDLLEAFLSPPLYNCDYSNGFGTLYTVIYQPDAGSARWCWPNGQWKQTLAHFREGRRRVHYGPSGARVSSGASPRVAPRPRDDLRRPDAAAAIRTARFSAELRGLEALRAGLAAGGCKMSPMLTAWFREAQRSGQIRWDQLGKACQESVCGS